MSWAALHIKVLTEGYAVSFRPKGNSMIPHIQSGQLCHVAPYDRYADPDDDNFYKLKKGDIVLVKVKRVVYLHMITGFKKGQVQISNAAGHINGWTSISYVYGVLKRVET